MTADDNSLIGQRWVRIMCDYSAEGVWDRDGCACGIDDLPVSPGLAERILAWQDWYEANAQWELGVPGASPIDGGAFNTEGREIARAVKRELPDWTVVYFDEEKCDLNRPRKWFEYEITLDDQSDI